jgi:translation elongation factor EF-1alpha
VLVVSSCKKEFESGFEETKQEIIIAHKIGIKKLIVVINKMDLIGWDKEQFDYIVTKISPLTKISNFIPISAITCSGILNYSSDTSKWVCDNGKSLIEILEYI